MLDLYIKSFVAQVHELGEDMDNNNQKTKLFAIKEMEWGVNSEPNTTYMNYEFDIDSL